MIRAYNGLSPIVASTAFVDPSAQIIGDVEIGEHSSINYLSPGLVTSTAK